MHRLPLRRDELQSLIATFSAPYADQPISFGTFTAPAIATSSSDGARAADAQRPESAPAAPAPPEIADGDFFSAPPDTSAFAGEERAAPLPAEAAPDDAGAFAATPAGGALPLVDATDWLAPDAGWGATAKAAAASSDIDLPAECNVLALEPPRLAIGKTYYVDAAGGSDANNGLSAGAAFKSLAHVQSLIADGDTIRLKCGAVWYEQLRFSASDVTVQSYGTGANPLIVGDGVRNGIVVKGENGRVENIDVTGAHNGVYVAGEGASMTVIGGNYMANGTGIVAGDGGRLILVDGAHCSGSRAAIGAGDGIQINVDASAGLHTIRNVVCERNEIAGVNAKAGTVWVSGSVLSFNGEPGWIAQNMVDAFDIQGCRIEGNNQSDNGDGQASIEDRAVVHSTGNLYINPHNGAVATVQINIVPSNGWTPAHPHDRPTTLYSVGDTFINTAGQTNTVGSIQVQTGDTPAIVSIAHAVFEHAAGAGTAIKAHDASALTLMLESNTFNMTDTVAVYLHAAADFGAQLATNTFSRTDGGAVFRIGDTLFDAADTLDLFAQYAFDAGAALAGPPDAAAALAEPLPAPEVHPPDAVHVGAHDADYVFG